MCNNTVIDYEVDTIGLRKAMIDNNIDTIEQFSAKTGVNRNTIAEVLSGKSYPSSMVMKKMAITLSMNFESAGRIFFKPKLA